jgi:hypothetical protein
MQNMLGVLPFASVGAWAAVIYFRGCSEFRGWRWSLVLSCTLLGAFALVLTESLSALHGLKPEIIIAAWSLYLLVPAGLLFQIKFMIRPAGEFERLVSKLKQVPFWNSGLLLMVVIVMLLMAVASPPMNFDVQSYHLPRQIFWLMQGSVQHFNATYPFQNCHPVLTEFLGLNLMLLSGGDTWHNLVQWTYMMAACGLVTLVTRSLGGDAKAQGLALLFIVLVPVVFFQASNSKNDIVTSFFILIPLFIGLKIWNRSWNAKVSLLLLAALTAGLAMASKGTAAAYLPSIAVLILIACLRTGAWRSLVLAFVPGLLLLGLTILPNTLRNLATYDSITGPSAGMTNERHDAGSVLGVAIKNVANEYAFGSGASIHNVETAARRTLEFLGLDPDDPHTDLGALQLGGTRLHFFYFEGCEDVIPAPIQTTLCLLLPFCFLVPSFRNRTGAIALGGVVLAAFVLFCALFRWQPWGGRLLIPFFFMAAPLVGTAGALIVPFWIPFMVSALAVLFLEPHMMFQGQRHLFGWQSVFRLSKEKQMSIAFMGRAEEIRKAAGMLAGKKTTMVLIDGKDAPIYGLLREVHRELPGLQIHSGHLAEPSNADAIVEAVNGDEGKAPLGYHCDWSGKYFRFYSRDR